MYYTASCLACIAIETVLCIARKTSPFNMPCLSSSSRSFLIFRYSELLSDDLCVRFDSSKPNFRYDSDTPDGVIKNELKAYNEKVYNKDQILVFTKCDAFNEKKLNDIKKNINGINVENAFFISSVTGFNIDSLCRKGNEMINNDKEKDDDNFDQKSSTWEP